MGALPYHHSTVTGNARIEGLAWVNSGATVGGNVVVKDNAVVRGGGDLSGNLVLGGDAEMWISCSSGTYLMFDPRPWLRRQWRRERRQSVVRAAHGCGAGDHHLVGRWGAPARPLRPTGYASSQKPVRFSQSSSSAVSPRVSRAGAGRR